MSQSIQQILRSAGYRWTSRTSGWCEVLVVGDGETWLGRGLTPDEGLDDAVRQMLPSRLGRLLLQENIGPIAASETRSPEPSATIHPGDASNADIRGAPSTDAPTETSTDAPTDAPTDVSADVSADRPIDPSAEVVTEDSKQIPDDSPLEPRPAADPGEGAPPAAALSVPSIESPPVSTAGVPAPAVAAPPRAPRLTIPEAVARHELERLRTELEDTLSEWERMSVPFLRMHLCRMACDLRALDEAAMEWSDATVHIRSTIGTLVGLGRRWWPGHLHVLENDASPSAAWLDVNSAGLPSTVVDEARRCARLFQAPASWTEAAHFLAEVVFALAEKAPPLDHMGWRDDATQQNTAVLPDRPGQLADRVRKVIEEVSGPLREETAIGVMTDPLPLKSVPLRRLVAAARVLRWLRMSPLPSWEWGAIMGRLRWIADRGRLQPDARKWLTSVISHTTRPAESWARDLHLDREAEQRRSARTQALAKVPGPKATTQNIGQWISHCLQVGATAHELCEAVGKERWVLWARMSQSVTQFVAQNRKDFVRRILSRVPEADETAVEGGTGQDLELTEWPVRPATRTAPEAELLTLARSRTQGRRLLFVSNREDPRLSTRLQQLLAPRELVWVGETGPIRVENVCVGIAQGHYELVLAATGFLDHSTERKLKDALPKGTPFVRVNKGRPLATIRAIVRDLGLGPVRLAG